PSVISLRRWIDDGGILEGKWAVGSGLARSTDRVVLPCVTVDDNSSGRAPLIVTERCERYRVSSKNSPSAAAPDAWIWPSVSSTAKLLAFFSTCRPAPAVLSVAGMLKDEMPPPSPGGPPAGPAIRPQTTWRSG